MSSETELLAQAVAAAIKEHFAQKFEAFAGELKRIEQRIAAIPTPENGKDATPVDEEALAQRVIASIRLPKDGEPGKDAPPIDEKALTANLLRDLSVRFEAAVNAFPKPKDGEQGKDAPAVDVDRLEKTIVGKLGPELLQFAEAQIAIIPKPKDGEPGKDAPPVDEEAMVQRICKLIPLPKDGDPGKDAPAVDEAAIVQRVAALIPVPKNGDPGKDAPPIDYLHLSQIIREEVDARVKMIPPAEKGEKGDAGQDALEARIVDGLDETRSYPRGTYAVHRNAFLKAMRPTGPINGSVTNAGWQVLFAGPLAVTAQLGEDDRTLELITETAGESIKAAVALPFPVDRGVWKQGAYCRGDCVTRNGSFWIAQRDTERTPGDASTDWRLAVKQMRAG